jgi:rare lipoprotein A
MKLPGPSNPLLSGIALAALVAATPIMAAAPSAPVAPANGPQADFPVVVGAPYQIDGVTFVPSDSMNFDSVGYATVGQEGRCHLGSPSHAALALLCRGHRPEDRAHHSGPR